MFGSPRGGAWEGVRTASPKVPQGVGAYRTRPWVELAFASERGAVVCLLAKGDETRQHEGDRFVPCETDGEIFRRAVERTLARRAGDSAAKK